MHKNVQVEHTPQKLTEIIIQHQEIIYYCHFPFSFLCFPKFINNVYSENYYNLFKGR